MYHPNKCRFSMTVHVVRNSPKTIHHNPPSHCLTSVFDEEVVVTPLLEVRVVGLLVPVARLLQRSVEMFHVLDEQTLLISCHLLSICIFVKSPPQSDITGVVYMILYIVSFKLSTCILNVR